MKFVRTKPFLKQYLALSPPVRKKVDKKLLHLLQDIRHPGLSVRKMVNQDNIWEARIDEHTRVTFQWVDETVILRRVGTHEIYRKP
jgi:mRNA-degrading endonuclease RelE of RelBE toxin-antitoxin system